MGLTVNVSPFFEIKQKVVIRVESFQNKMDISLLVSPILK